MLNAIGSTLRELPGPILLTGHTGFKGTWMTLLLEQLRIPVIGFSLPPEENSLFERAQRKGVIPEIYEDIRNYSSLAKFIDLHQPSAVIHMAAQPLVIRSYSNARETFDVNVMGTVNLLDVAFKHDCIQAILVVTTDKVYKNNNSGRTFKETDPLEGKDPYSASKVGTEAVVSAWQQLRSVSGGPKIVSVRAGNVIGGGDWADHRLLPDLAKALFFSIPTTIRNPTSTRPWQHVLDPLAGYLLTIEYLLNSTQTIKALNFGPVGTNLSTQAIYNIIQGQNYNLDLITIATAGTQIYEAESLAIDSSLSRELIGYKSLISQEAAVISTLNWWEKYSAGDSAHELCKADIEEFIKAIDLEKTNEAK